jgi:M6 family metalloprotease-like protein
MPQLRTGFRWTTFLFLVVSALTVAALEPPTEEQLERYRLDGTLEARTAAAREFGNHRMSPQLSARIGGATTKALPTEPKVLPADGAPAVLTLLIAFEDMPGYTDAEVVDDRIFGDGEPNAFPLESLTNFYRRASYGLLEITGSTLGWYTTPYPRADVVETYVGRQSLIKEVITHYDDEGHDFSRYDNDGDGFVDYLAVIWTGEHGEWAEFWWGYQTVFWNDDFTVDGVQLGTYSWQWENYDWPGSFTPDVLIHETGHALGLPDYYDYDSAIGPDGGVGGLDQMDGNWGDHNAFSKWVLGWLTPEVYNQDGHQMLTAPTGEMPEAAVFMHGDPVADPYAEYFVVQYRRRSENDATFPTDGLLIWHVDARVDDEGRFLYDNSYTEHKLLRLMEADGLEEIENNGRANAGDFYVPGSIFSDDTIPNSRRYDGAPTNLAIDTIAFAGDAMSYNSDLGSGCAIFCNASVGPTGWPGLPVSFSSSMTTANCDGTASVGWEFGDGGSSGDSDTTHTYVSAGTYDWLMATELGDAWCHAGNTIEVCTDFRCWQWTAAQSMVGYRAGHAAVELTDGRILVVGGESPEGEAYNPSTDTWTTVASPTGSFPFARGVRLDDGRVLVVDGPTSEEVDTEIYDPATDTWSSTGQLNHDRTAHSAIKLADGRVLVVGGFFESPSSPVEEVEVFDPASETWAVVGSLSGLRILPGMTTVPDGRAFIVGGREGTYFDPVSDTLTRATFLPVEWQGSFAVNLDDGRVLVGSPGSGLMTLIWNPTSERWEGASQLNGLRYYATATKLPNGFVVLAGGHDGYGTPHRTTEFFDPVSRSWSNGSSLVTGRAAHSATMTGSGRLIVIGGYAGEDNPYQGYTNEVEHLAQPLSPPRNPGGRVTP